MCAESGYRIPRKSKIVIGVGDDCYISYVCLVQGQDKQETIIGTYLVILHCP